MPANTSPQNSWDRFWTRGGGRALAIKAKCWDCQGGDADTGVSRRIRECPMEGRCPLWSFRPYQVRHG
jgi:hypothetical protein